MINKLLRVRWEQSGHQVVVQVAGEVDLVTAPLLVQALSDAAAAPRVRSVLVDLTKVAFFGAIGLSALLVATRRGKATGIPVIVVTRPGQPPHRAITLCQLQCDLTVIDALRPGSFSDKPYNANAIDPGNPAVDVADVSVSAVDHLAHLHSANQKEVIVASRVGGFTDTIPLKLWDIRAHRWSMVTPVGGQPPIAGVSAGMSSGYEGNMPDAPMGSPEKDTEDWVTGDEPMTGPQHSYLQTLAREAGEDVPPDLSKAQASDLIDRLQKKTGRG